MQLQCHISVLAGLYTLCTAYILADHCITCTCRNCIQLLAKWLNYWSKWSLSTLIQVLFMTCPQCKLRTSIKTGSEGSDYSIKDICCHFYLSLEPSSIIIILKNESTKHSTIFDSLSSSNSLCER